MSKFVICKAYQRRLLGGKLEICCRGFEVVNFAILIYFSYNINMYVHVHVVDSAMECTFAFD